MGGCARTATGSKEARAAKVSVVRKREERKIMVRPPSNEEVKNFHARDAFHDSFYGDGTWRPHRLHRQDSWRARVRVARRPGAGGQLSPASLLSTSAFTGDASTVFHDFQRNRHRGAPRGGYGDPRHPSGETYLPRFASLQMPTAAENELGTGPISRASKSIALWSYCNGPAPRIF